MLLKSVKLNNFRNLDKIELDVSPQINIFLGRNGQGKTNLLEGLSYLALGRSHRGSLDRDIIRFDAEIAHVGIVGEDSQSDPFRLDAAVPREGKKKLKLDGQAVPRRSDLVGHLSIVHFDPDEVHLTKGSPDHRRRFLDYTLSIGSKEYFRQLLSYRRALAQKNRFLKHYGSHSSAADELEVWDEELIRFGSPLIQARMEILAPLEHAAAESYEALAPEGGALSLSIETTVSQTPVRELDEIEQAFRKSLERLRPKERLARHSLVGPHRDHLEVDLRARPIRTYGSQGENRSASIALKLAQAELIYRQTDERPAVFLDDIFSELDRTRTEALQKWLHRRHQLFVATARIDDVRGMEQWSKARTWIIRDGGLTEVDDLQRAQAYLEN